MTARALPDRAGVVVIGAGLAGLSAARLLHERGHHAVVLEASDGVGGRVRTDLVDGFRLDRGFQVLLTEYPELHRQFDVDALRLRSFDPGALVWMKGRGHVVSVVRVPPVSLDGGRRDVGDDREDHRRHQAHELPVEAHWVCLHRFR